MHRHALRWKTINSYCIQLTFYNWSSQINRYCKRHKCQLIFLRSTAVQSSPLYTTLGLSHLSWHFYGICAHTTVYAFNWHIFLANDIQLELWWPLFHVHSIPCRMHLAGEAQKFFFISTSKKFFFLLALRHFTFFSWLISEGDNE